MTLFLEDLLFVLGVVCCHHFEHILFGTLLLSDAVHSAVNKNIWLTFIILN